MSLPVLLFVCTGNICRSAMAHGIAQQYEAKLKFRTMSAGVDASSSGCAAKNAVAACKALGIDLSEHKPEQVTKSSLKRACIGGLYDTGSLGGM